MNQNKKAFLKDMRLFIGIMIVVITLCLIAFINHAPATQKNAFTVKGKVTDVVYQYNPGNYNGASWISFNINDTNLFVSPYLEKNTPYFSDLLNEMENREEIIKVIYSKKASILPLDFLFCNYHEVIEITYNDEILSYNDSPCMSFDRYNRGQTICRIFLLSMATLALVFDLLYLYFMCGSYQSTYKSQKRKRPHRKK